MGQIAFGWWQRNPASFNLIVRCQMGSEIIVFLVPVGWAMLTFLLYRAIRSASRIYPIPTLVIVLLWAGHMVAQLQSYQFTWFFIYFSLVTIPLGIAVHVAKWPIERRNKLET